MGKFVDLTGQIFNYLTVIRKSDKKTKDNRILWECRCKCGNITYVTSNALKHGTKSCGCYSRENASKRSRKDLVGKKFGRLTVTSYSHTNEKGRAVWNCKCECGNSIKVSSSYLLSHETKSCGCLVKEVSRKQALIRNKGNKFGLKHGKHEFKLYKVWKSMNGRCNCPTNSQYEYYGGRGIEVCSQWKNNFNAFYEWGMTNGYNEKASKGECTIDRIDVNGDYEPSNCRWVNLKVQANNKRNNRKITFNGITKNLCEWAEITGIRAETIRTRIDKLTWSIEKALTTPARKIKQI